jgi:GNAT superfamily N-acetyltransferase
MSELPIVTLADGARAQLRPLTPADKPRVQEAFRRLSRTSRFSRFFTPLEVLDGALLDRLTSADGVNHVVWAALDPDLPDDPGMGAASFWRSRSDPTEAEFSVTVADEHQGRGIGTLLLATLWILARRVGIERFRLVALSENFPVLHWMETIGATIDCDNNTVCDMVLDLSDDAKSAIPMTPEGDELLGWLERLPDLLDS